MTNEKRPLTKEQWEEVIEHLRFLLMMIPFRAPAYSQSVDVIEMMLKETIDKANSEDGDLPPMPSETLTEYILSKELSSEVYPILIDQKAKQAVEWALSKCDYNQASFLFTELNKI